MCARFWLCDSLGDGEKVVRCTCVWGEFVISNQFGVNSYFWSCGSYCACECPMDMEVM